MLKIHNLQAGLEGGKEILKGLDLAVGKGEVHAIMGPNGAGKSTLGYVLAGRQGYEITDGSVTLDGVDVMEMEPEERARAGLFLEGIGRWASGISGEGKVRRQHGTR